MHDIVTILFIGKNWFDTVFYFLEEDTNGEVVWKKKTKSSGHTCQNTSEPYKLIGIENWCGRSGLDEVVNFVNDLDWQEMVGAYIITEKMSDAKKILTEISRDKTYYNELYGVDPDYFQTLIPLESSNRKIIENYLLGLKLDQSLKGRVKLLIKKLLVALNFSEKLYEKFVIVISPKLEN